MKYNLSKLKMPKHGCIGFGVSKHILDFFPRNTKSCVIACGKHFYNSSEFKKIVFFIQRKHLGVYTFICPSGEPTPDSVDKLSSFIRERHSSVLVAVGGGSVLDTAKASAALAYSSDNCNDYFLFGKKIDPSKRMFLICLPTTSGTGAEMTANAVLIDSNTKDKKSLRHPSMMPEVSLVDPLLTLNLPRHVIASSGLDALVQAIESYCSPRATEVTMKYSALSFQKICNYLVPFYSNSENRNFARQMAFASMYAGLAFSNCGLGAIHGIAHPVGSLLNVPHGIACSILMEPVFRFNQEKSNSKYIQLMNLLYKDSQMQTSEHFFELLKKFKLDFGIPDNFKEYGLNSSHYPFIVQHCRSGSMLNNPVFLSDEDVVSILKMVS